VSRYAVVAWRSANYAVTNMRVFCIEGLVRHRSAETLLTSLTDIRTQIGFFGRQLGYGNIVLISASGE
jgi:hypothetical protein